jgi:type I site-specific restriction-modification system R (restriction) subunit
VVADRNDLEDQLFGIFSRSAEHCAQEWRGGSKSVFQFDVQV